MAWPSLGFFGKIDYVVISPSSFLMGPRSLMDNSETQPIDMDEVPHLGDGDMQLSSKNHLSVVYNLHSAWKLSLDFLFNRHTYLTQ